MKRRALEVEKIACANHGKCEYIGSVCGTLSTLKWLTLSMMGGRKVKKMRLAKNSGSLPRKAL